MTNIGIDCGANVGEITEKLLRQCDEVYAFEPNPYAFKALKERYIYNPRVHCLNKAVLNRDDKVKLFFHENSDLDEVKWSVGSSLLDFKGNVNKEKHTTVEAINLSEFIKKLKNPIKILKLDVEGVECEIINDLIDHDLIHNIEQVFVELHGKKYPPY